MRCNKFNHCKTAKHKKTMETVSQINAINKNKMELEKIDTDIKLLNAQEQRIKKLSDNLKSFCNIEVF